MQRYFKASAQQKKQKKLKSNEYSIFFNFSRSSAHAWAAPPPPSGPARPAGTTAKGTKMGSRRIWRREEEGRTIGRGGTEEEKRRRRRKRVRATEVSEGWPSYISRILENTSKFLPELFCKGIYEVAKGICNVLCSTTYVYRIGEFESNHQVSLHFPPQKKNNY